MNEQDWIKVENTHEAIVPKELFDVVQKIMETDTRVSPNEENVYLLSGLIKCGTCGQNMIRRMSSKNGKKYYYYYCSTYKNTGKCSSHNISEVKLYDAVFEVIQSTLSFLSDAYNLLKDMDGRPHDAIGVSLLNKQMESQAREINKYSELKVQLYMDMTDGIVSKEEFKDINGTFTSKIDNLRYSLRQNEKKKEKKLALNVNNIPWIQEFLQYQNVDKLDRRIVVSLIERVVVYEDNKLEVVFQHKEELEEILKVAKMLKEGRA